MRFTEKYELLESFTTGAVETFVANDKIRGRRVLVHIVQCDPQKPNQTTLQWVLEAFRQVAPEPAGFVLEAGKYSGTLYAYLVTELPDNATLRAWVYQYERRGPDVQQILGVPAGPAKSQPPAEAVKPKQPQDGATGSLPTRKGGEFTDFFRWVPPPAEKSSPPSGKDAPPQVGEFTVIFGSAQRPGEKSSPASGVSGKDVSNSTPAKVTSVGTPSPDLCCGAPAEFEQPEKPSKISQLECRGRQSSLCHRQKKDRAKRTQEIFLERAC
jgi:hypothetical protein